jgi:predicted PurR-regulated permease PerM
MADGGVSAAGKVAGSEAAIGAEDAAGRKSVKATFRGVSRPSSPFVIVLLLAILVSVVFFLSASALFVFGVGVALAFFLVPLVDSLEHRGMARSIAAIVVVIATVVLLIAVVGIVTLIVLDQGIAFVANLPTILREVETWYESLTLPDWLRAGFDGALLAVGSSLRSLDQGTVIAGFAGGFVSLLGGFSGWLLLPFFLFYLLKDQPAMQDTFYRRIPAPWEADIRKVLTICVGNFARYFKAEFLVGLIMFALVTVGMLGIGTVMDAPSLVRFAILLGLIAFVMELIPQIGPILSYLPALLLAIPAGFDAVLVISIFYFVIFNIEGSILVPNLEGRMIDFDGASVLVLIAVGFALGGIIGAILVLPLASIIRDLFRYFFDKAVAESLIVALPSNS